MEERNESGYSEGRKHTLKPNELRIGNLVSKDGDVFEADFITIQMAHNYEPIPLTEEWLIKFGFTKANPDFGHQDNYSFNQWTLGNFEIGRHNGGFLCDGLDQMGFNSGTLYVHQLQNLYFALTSEELTI